MAPLEAAGDGTNGLPEATASVQDLNHSEKDMDKKKPNRLFSKLGLKGLKNHKLFRSMGARSSVETCPESDVAPETKPTKHVRFKRSLSQSDADAEPQSTHRLDFAQNENLFLSEALKLTPRRWRSVPRKLSIATEEDVVDSVDHSENHPVETIFSPYSRLPAIQSASGLLDTTIQSEEISSTKKTLPEKSLLASSVPVSVETVKSAVSRVLSADSSSGTSKDIKDGTEIRIIAPVPKSVVPLTRGTSSAKLHSQWISSVHIRLIEGKGLPPMDRNGLSDPFCKFRLGEDKHRSKTAFKTLNPRWDDDEDEFDLFIYDTETKDLEITVWDWNRGRRDDYIGKVNVDLSVLVREIERDLWLDILDDNLRPRGSIRLTLRISDSEGQQIEAETTADSSHAAPSVPATNLERYNLKSSFHDTKDVGVLTVKVFCGCALRAADLNGRSDPYCVIQLGKQKVQTQVIHKTLDPHWNQIFTLPVHDIHTALYIVVWGTDQDKKADFLGSVAIPLLKVQNNSRRWYALKDEKLAGRAKGSILLEMELQYNPVRAVIRTLHPRTPVGHDTPREFRRQVFMKNMTRLRRFIAPVGDLQRFLQTLFTWEDRTRSLTAFIIYMVVVYFFELWMVPGFFLAWFIKSYVRYHYQVEVVQSSYARDLPDEAISDDENEGDDEEEEEWDPIKEVVGAKSKSFYTLVKNAKHSLGVVQQKLGNVADLLERVHSTFDFTVPWLSFLAMGLLGAATLLLYFIPLRLILLVWGVHKFTMKLRKPGSLGGNALLDFLSRNETQEESRCYRELKPHPKEISRSASSDEPVTPKHMLSKRVASKASLGSSA